MSYLKDRLPTFLVGVLVAALFVVVLRKKSDNSAVTLTDFQMNQLKSAMKSTMVEFDSINKVNAVVIPTDFKHSDSLQQINLDLNNKIVYELQKKNELRLDTVSSDELKRIFAEYGKQHPVSSD